MIHSYYKKKNIIYCLIWTEYAVSAIFCVLCKVYQSELVGFSVLHNRWYDLSDTTWWGYLLLIVCNLIAFKPFDLFDHDSTLGDLGSRKWPKQFLSLFCYAYIVLALIFILLSLNNIKGILSINDYGTLRASWYGNSNNESTFVITNNFFANICFKLCLQFKYLSVIVAMVMFKEKYRIRFASLLLVITFSIYYIYATGNAARGGLLIFVFCAFLIVISFYKYMSKANKRRIIIMVCTVGAIVGVFFFAVTVSRFGGSENGSNPIFRNISFYLGHGPIEFSKITGSLDDFAYGKTIVGRLLNHYFGTEYSWDAIQGTIGYPQIGPVFVTYLGYLYTDFGIVSCLLFVSSWSYFMCNLLKKKNLRMSTLFLFLYYLSYYVTGNFAVGRLEYAGMITAHIIALMIRFVEDILRRKTRKVIYTEI